MDIEQYFQSTRVSLIGPIEDKMVASFDQQVAIYLKELGADLDAVVITISTGGGSTNATRDLYERIRMLHELMPVSIVAVGNCNSGGVALFMAVPKSRRYTTSNTRFLIHQTSTGSREIPEATLAIRGQQEQELVFDRQKLQAHTDWVYGLIAKGCGKRKRDVRSLAIPGTWLTGKEAVEFGLASKLLV